MQRDIVVSVSNLIAALSSSNVALDGRHTPALYSRFLSSLMLKHALMMSDLETSEGSGLSAPPAFLDDHRHTTPPEGYSWPDVDRRADEQSESNSPHYLDNTELDMDYSLAHFIRTVSSQNQPHHDMPYQDMTQWESTWKSEPQPPHLWSQVHTIPQDTW